MDTYMSVRTYGTDAGDQVKAEAARLETLFSVTDKDSEISALNRDGEVKASADTLKLVGESLRISRATGGALDVTVYPAVRAWGFTTGENRVPSKEELAKITEKIGYEGVRIEKGTIRIPKGAGVDLGAVAKGYLSDRAAAILKENGVSSALIDLGGNIGALGSRPDGSPWRIAVRDPAGDGSVGTVEASDLFVVTSGGYERYFNDASGRRIWHIIDPATASPADSGLLSATVVGKSGTTADGLSTAVFVMGEERAVGLWRETRDFEMILVTSGGEIVITDGLKDAFTREEDSGYTLRIVS